jgi:hypothetical protein
MNRHLPSIPQSRTWKYREDEGTGFELTSAETGEEFTSSVMKRETTRTTVRTVEGVIVDVAIMKR